MDLAFSKEEMAFREEVRAFFRDNVPPETRRKMVEGRHLSKDEMVTWWRILNKKGWGVSHWPKEYGGTGWTSVQHYIFNEELQMHPAPAPLAFGVSMVGPVIYTFGNETQKKQYLPRIANVDDWWCQGFSEPGSGSDLASLKTKAERKGDKYIINGQKTWTTLAQHADMIFCLCRTDTNAKKQMGISFIVFDMKSKGVTVRPIETIDGGHEVNEVFFDDVEVPVENLIGEENKGWDYAKFLLGNERTGIARVGVSKERLRRIKDLASKVESNGKPMHRGPGFPREARGLRDRAEGARAHAAARRRRRRQARQGQAQSGVLGPEDQGFGNPADHHRTPDGSDRPVRRALRRAWRRRLQRDHGLDRPDRAELLQQPQGLDLRRLQRDPAQHHHQGGAGALSLVNTVVPPRRRGTQYAAAVVLTMRLRLLDPRIRGDDDRRCRRRTPAHDDELLAERVKNMDFDLSEEQRLLKESIDGLLTNSYDFDARKKYQKEKGGWSKAVWGKLAEQGLLGLPFAEADGGFGAGAVETMIVMEALGKALVLEPYLATVVIGGGFLRHGGSAEQKAAHIPGIIDGSKTFAFAQLEKNSRYDLSRCRDHRQEEGRGLGHRRRKIRRAQRRERRHPDRDRAHQGRPARQDRHRRVPGAGERQGRHPQGLSDPGRPACRRHHVDRRRGRRGCRDRRSRERPCR